MSDIRVRTAYDLERKYNLSNLSSVYKAVENTSEGLTKINREVGQFVEEIGEEIEGIKDQVDGNITTWFYEGTPTLENAPANEWTTDELKQDHINDLYYEKDSGHCYKFVCEDGVYKWAQKNDDGITEVLSIANSAKDTADSKRRVFVVQPTPPYDAGDIWLKSTTDSEGNIQPGEMYRCRLGKSGNEEFAETDWIKATNYTDDSMATSLFDDLQTTLETEYPTLVEFYRTTDGIVSDVADKYLTIKENEEQRIEITQEISSTMSQTSQGWDMKFNNIKETVETQGDTITTNQTNLEKHIQFVDGKIILVSNENNKQGQIKLRIENDKIAFMNNSNETIGYWTPTSFQLGNYAYIPRANGSLDFKKVS